MGQYSWVKIEAMEFGFAMDMENGVQWNLVMVWMG